MEGSKASPASFFSINQGNSAARGAGEDYIINKFNAGHHGKRERAKGRVGKNTATRTPNDQMNKMKKILHTVVQGLDAAFAVIMRPSRGYDHAAANS